MAAPAGGSVQDTPKLEYNLLRKFQVFNTSSVAQLRGEFFNLVACSPKYGLVFVALTDGLLAVYPVTELLYGKADPLRVTVKLPMQPTHIAVNCDGELLAVVGNIKSIFIYNVKDLWGQDASPKLSVPRGYSTWVRDMQWSPTMNETLAIGFDDKITILHVGTGERNDNTDSTAMGCLSWHPSGSSLVVGDGDGSLCVYSPDLSLEKRIPAPAPPLLDGAPLLPGAVQWMSNNQFAVVYYKHGTQRRESVVTLINAPEGELPPRAEYVGRLQSDLLHPWYRLLEIKPWNVMVCVPTRTTIIRLLPPDSYGGDSQAPVQLLSEFLGEDYIYSLGVALDTGPVLRLSSQSHLHQPTNETMTILHVLTHTGDLATYTVGERPSTPSVDTESSRTTSCSEPAALEPPSMYSNKGSPCAALVDPAERARHAASSQHRTSVFAEQQLEELVREYPGEQDLALLGRPAGAASQADDSLVELADGDYHVL